MQKKHNIETFRAILMHETDNAYLLDVDGVTAWFPKSQVQFEGEDLECPEWLAIEKEIV